MIDLATLKPGQRQWEDDVGVRMALDGRLTWYYRLRVNGRRKTFTARHAQNKTQARGALKSERGKAFDGTWRPKTVRVTLQQRIAEFFEAKAELATLAKYKAQWRLHLRPAFGSMGFDEVSTADCERYRRKRRAELTPRGKKVSEATAACCRCRRSWALRGRSS